MEKYEKGKIIKVTVSGIESYGIFAHVGEYYSGLIHISEISNKFVRNPADFVSVGEVIEAEILEINEQERQMKLSIKNLKNHDLSRKNRRQIVETKAGFKTLAFKLPIWISENLQNAKNKINSIDK